jgi:hypothetical protein
MENTAMADTWTTTPAMADTARPIDNNQAATLFCRIL